jgi:hypothetical protein
VGYDVHITRAEPWYESKSRPIKLDEWLRYIAADAEMRLDNYAEADVGGGEVLRVESEGLAVWTAYIGHGLDGNMAWFSFHDGRVIVKNPDDEILAKMRDIAAALKAKVIGDEGEFY